MKRFKKTGLIALAVVIGLIILGVFFFFGIPYLLYSAVENWVTSRLGFDFYLAQLYSTVFVIALTALFPVLAGYLICGKRRLYGALALIGIHAAICLLVYTVGSSVCCDRRTGKPLCYFADTGRGRVWSYTPGFEPRAANLSGSIHAR